MFSRPRGMWGPSRAKRRNIEMWMSSRAGLGAYQMWIRSSYRMVGNRAVMQLLEELLPARFSRIRPVRDAGASPQRFSLTTSCRSQGQPSQSFPTVPAC